ncbi:hypothetical protein C7120_07220 [Prevotella sp. oral taxon 376]|nr:hypothetical protein C7120_07220 [Prevotella sp. oral taxon 376]
MTGVMLKLRPFPAGSVWKQTSHIAPDMLTGKATGRVIEQGTGFRPQAKPRPSPARTPFILDSF